VNCERLESSLENPGPSDGADHRISYQ
jgi:hypothetical protein